MSLQPHVDRHAILALEKQFRLFDVVGEQPWHADLEAGTIVFGGERRRLRRSNLAIELGAAVLGTEDGASWLWGWANPGGFPEPVVAAGRAVGDYGRVHDLPPLYELETPLSEDVTLERIGVIASGALGLKATYVGPAGEGLRILFGLDDPRLELPPPETARMITVLSTLLQGGLVRDWPAALEGYAQARGVTLGQLGIEVELDELGRVAPITGSPGS